MGEHFMKEGRSAMGGFLWECVAQDGRRWVWGWGWFVSVGTYHGHIFGAKTGTFGTF